MTTEINLQEINRSLTRIACQAVIYEAASMLKSDPLIDAEGYMFMGADEILCRPDESIATIKERYGYFQYCCCRDLGISRKDLTLLDCVKWLCSEERMESDDDVRLDDVLLVMGVRQA